MSEDDRPRKSWKEIDKAKDRSRHRQEERPQSEGRRGGQRGQRSYRSALDHLFSSGKIAELVEKKTPGSTETREGESRLTALARIEKAMDRESICREVDLYRERFGDLPEELELQGKVLEHRDPELQRRAMEIIDGLLEREQPRRRRAMVAQLKTIRDLGDDRELVELARKLILRLE